MSPAELLAEIRDRGVCVRVDGSHLRLRPRGPLTPDLLNELRTQKPALIQLLDSGPTVGQSLGGVEESEPSLAVSDVAAMRLDEFAEAGLVLRVRSDALDEVVLFASNNATVDAHEPCIVYRARELVGLLDLDRSSLKQVHMIKKMFRGTVEPS